MKQMNVITAMKKISKRLVEKKRIGGAEQYKFPVNFEYTLPTFIQYGLPEADIAAVVAKVKEGIEKRLAAVVEGFAWATGATLIAGGKTLVVSTDTPAITGEDSGVDLVERATDLDSIGEKVNEVVATLVGMLNSEDTWKQHIKSMINDNEQHIKALQEQNKALTKMAE